LRAPRSSAATAAVDRLARSASAAWLRPTRKRNCRNCSPKVVTRWCIAIVHPSRLCLPRDWIARPETTKPAERRRRFGYLLPVFVFIAITVVVGVVLAIAGPLPRVFPQLPGLGCDTCGILH
jgi:hypothetical protein